MAIWSVIFVNAKGNALGAYDPEDVESPGDALQDIADGAFIPEGTVRIELYIETDI